MAKQARSDHPIHELISSRWSPYGFDSRPVPLKDLLSLFEAARWAASAFNEQPWHYLVARRESGEQFKRMLSCLVPANQAWAGRAPVLVLTVIGENYRRNGKPNNSARHDLGLASATLSFEAGSRGLAVHQMAGIDPDRARDIYGIPDGYVAVTALAIGYKADPRDLDPELKERDTAPRSRRPLEEFVFSDSWANKADFLE